MTEDRQYSDAVLDSMQVAYGEGFLSPGGATETRDLLNGVAVSGTACLDYGSGVGGASLLLVNELGANRVVGVDVEAAAVARARSAAQRAGLADRIDFHTIRPEAPLELPSESFDLVITKDVICHVRDKGALFEEILRVLRPGGLFAIADWTLGTAAAGKAVFEDWLTQLESYGLVFWYETAAAYVDTLRGAGFISIDASDHTEWSTDNTRTQLEHALGPARESSTETLGSGGYEKRTRLTRARLAALEARGVEHWLIHATRPA